MQPELSPFTNNQVRKGGMTSNGLRDSTNVRNYFPTPGRANIIPDATQNVNTLAMIRDPNSFSEISSIGQIRFNPLKDVAVSKYGPGTLMSTNSQPLNIAGINDAHIGYVQQNDKKTQFVDYRNVDPTLVENLRINPLSIYAVGKDVNSREIPAFFTDVRPENYAEYTNDAFIDISDYTKELYVDGSPNVSILGMAEQNPFMGLNTALPNTTPNFTGKTYGGTTGSASNYADELYGRVNKDKIDGVYCKNDALVSFSQGYNVAPQLIDGIFNLEGARQSIPWGPIRPTGNPQTQQGGIWTKGDNPWPTVRGSVLPNEDKPLYLPKPNPYRYGLPGTLTE